MEAFGKARALLAHLGKFFRRIGGIAGEFAFLPVQRRLRLVLPAADDGVQLVAVHFEVEQPRDEAQPLPALRLDELREFALRQGDALFEIFKGKPDELLDALVGVPDPFAHAAPARLFLFVQGKFLGRVLAPDLPFGAVIPARAVLFQRKFKRDVRLVAVVIDDVRSAAFGAVRPAVQGEDHAVQYRRFAAARIAEDAEDAPGKEGGKIDLGGFGKAVDAAKG